MVITLKVIHRDFALNLDYLCGVQQGCIGRPAVEV